MTQQFGGFPSGAVHLTQVPDLFFSEVMPIVNDLVEMKLILFALWAVQQREGHYRYLIEDDFVHNQLLRESISPHIAEQSYESAILKALEQAVIHNVVLRAVVEDKVLYFINTHRGREAADAVEQGRFVLPIDAPLEVLPPRPNVFRLYESEIGQITPMVSEGLIDLETDYPAEWLIEAIRVAAEKQAKNLKFIRAVLERWRKEGKTTHEIVGRNRQSDGTGFISGEDAAFIQH